MSGRAGIVSASPSVGMLAGTAFGLVLANAAFKPALAQTTPDDGATRQLPAIPVNGTAGSTDGYQITNPSFDKLTAPLKDTPQSIVEIPKKLLDDENVITTRDALRNVPGVSLAAGEGGQQGDNLSIRGFNAQNDFYLDGMRDFGSYYRDPFNLDRIEVLEGPSSVLFGRGSSGGTINQVSKQPQLAPITQGTVTLGTDQLYRFTSDVNRAIDGVPGTAIRLNVMGNTNGVPGRDDAANRRFGFAPEVAFGLGTDTRLTLDYLHQQSYDTPDYGIPWLNGRPSPVKHDNFYGYAQDDFFRTNVNIVTAKLDHDFNDNLTVTNQLRYGNYTRDLRVTEPQELNQGIATNFVAANRPLSSVLVSRHDISLQSTEGTLDEQLYGTYRYGTGFVRNTLLAGVEVDRQTSTPTRYTIPTTTTPLLTPFSISLPRGTTVSSITRSQVDNIAPFATDTISLGEHFDIMGGWRWDRYDSTFRQVRPTALNLRRDDDLPSWRGALVFKPTKNGSIYFDYGTSFDPSAESLSLTAATATVAPEKTTTYEIGTKWDVMGGRLSLAGSLYEIEKANARETDPTNPTADILAGDDRVRGFQLSVTGHITDRWEVFTGYSLNDGVVVSSPNPNEVNHAIPNAPKHTFSLFTEYKLPMPAPLNDLEIGGGINLVSSRTASSTPVSGTSIIERAPGYVIGQLMAKYPVNDRISLQANIQNVSDTYYYDSLHPGHIVLGSSRAALFTLAAKF